MDRLRKYFPLLGLAAFYVVVMALRKVGVLTSYYIQILMFAMINVMVTLGSI